MNFSRRDGSRRRPGERGQAEIIGVVLLLAVTVGVVTATVVVGSAALSDARSDAETSTVENTMAHMSSKVSLVALGDSESRRFDLGTVERGDVSVREDAGRIELIQRPYNDSGNETVLYNETFGAVVYSGPNRDIAYQGGGVWIHDGDNSSMISPPEYHYRGTTLTLPVVRVTGEGSASGRVTGTVRRVRVADQPAAMPENPHTNGTIVIRIQSEYYEGWYEFLSQRAEGSTRIYHGNQTVVSELVVPQEVSVDHALALNAQEFNPPKNADVDEENIETGANTPSARPMIEGRVAKAREENLSAPSCLHDGGECTLDEGDYFVDGDLELGGDVKLNTSEGNITLVVNGDFDVGNNELNVTDGSDNGVTYFVNGTLEGSGNAHVFTSHTPEPEADRNVFFVAEDVFVASSGGVGTWDAVIYAPDATVDLTGGGNSVLRGALVADDIQMQGGGDVTIEHDSTLEGTEIEVTDAPSQVTYVHLSENVVEVQFDE